MPDQTPAAPPPSTTEDTASPKKDDGTSIKSLIITGANDFRVVFFYPLCTGIMTGVGFVLGKRLGERYFYGPTAKIA